MAPPYQFLALLLVQFFPGQTRSSENALASLRKRGIYLLKSDFGYKRRSPMNYHLRQKFGASSADILRANRLREPG